MTTTQYTKTETTHYDAWPSSEPARDTWFGVELQYVPDYDPDTFAAVSGFFSIHGAQPGTVEVQGDTGLKLEAFNDGDPGYHVHLTQAPGSGPFDIAVTLTYEVTTV